MEQKFIGQDRDTQSEKSNVKNRCCKFQFRYETATIEDISILLYKKCDTTVYLIVSIMFCHRKAVIIDSIICKNTPKRNNPQQ